MATAAPSSLSALARAALAACRKRRRMIVTAESCTGGLVASALTAIAGCSDTFDRGFVTYSNDAKRQMLGVKGTTLHKFGAVSSETAAEMARGALKNSRASISVAITGIAGPGGGSKQKPVGLVHFAAARKDGVMMLLERHYSVKGRTKIQRLAARDALILLTALGDPETAGDVTPAHRQHRPAPRTRSQNAETRRRTSRP